MASREIFRQPSRLLRNIFLKKKGHLQQVFLIQALNDLIHQERTRLAEGDDDGRADYDPDAAAERMAAALSAALAAEAGHAETLPDALTDQGGAL